MKSVKEYEKEFGKVNFCTIPEDELFRMFDFLGVLNIAKEGSLITKFLNDECIEKVWNNYDEVIVAQKQIFLSISPYPKKSIMSVDNYVKLKQV